MTDMITRAVKALEQCCETDDEWRSRDLDDVPLLELAREALLAALDVEDEALVETVARAIGLAEWYGKMPMPAPSETAMRETNKRLEHFAFHARAALTALKAHATQGETNP